MGESKSPIGDLIQARMDATGWSLRRIQHESGISKTQITNYLQGLKNMPHTENVHRLAIVLQLPEVVVVDALLATVGLARPRGGGVPDLEQAIDAQPWLDVRGKAGLKALARSARETSSC